jgi:hypothetical protein
MISSTLNQIFYRHNKFDSPDKIELLYSYFLTLNKKNEIQSILDCEKEILCEKLLQIDSYEVPVVTNEKDIILNIDQIPYLNPPPPPQPITTNHKSCYEPTQNDSLFWCIYIHIYGYNDYTQIGHKYGNSELNEKQKIIEFIKKNSKKIKDSNFKVSKSLCEEIISEFMVMNNQTTLLGLIALSIYYNVSLFIVNKQKNTYLKYSPNDYNGLPIVIYKLGKSHKKYTTEMETTHDLVKHIEHTMLCLETIDKPLKSISNYKSNELLSIASKLKLELPEKVKKDEVYRKISEYCIM